MKKTAKQTIDKIKRWEFEKATKPIKQPVAVYTAIFGDRDELAPAKEYKNVKYYCFTDKKTKQPGWTQTQVKQKYKCPIMSAKWYKHHPHRLFNTTFTIWVDGNITLKVNPTKLVNKHLIQTGHKIAMFKHAQFKTIYADAIRLIKTGKADEEGLKKQIIRYTKKGFWSDNLSEPAMIIANRRSGETKKLMETWWKETNKETKRDMISLEYSLWKTRTDINRIQGNLNNHYYIEKRHHKEPEIKAINQKEGKR